MQALEGSKPLARVASGVLGFVIAAIVVAGLGVFFLGDWAFVIAIVLLGVAVLVLGAAVETGMPPEARQPAPPARYACPGCGVDVYLGQPACRACGYRLMSAKGVSR